MARSRTRKLTTSKPSATALRAALRADRVARVARWILQGRSEHAISGACRRAWPRTAAQPLIVSAMQQIAEQGQVDPGLAYGWCVEATRAVYHRALREGDLPVALRAVNQMAALTRRPPEPSPDPEPPAGA